MSKKIIGSSEFGVRSSESKTYSVFRIPHSAFAGVSFRGKWPPDWWHHRAIFLLLINTVFISLLNTSLYAQQASPDEKKERKTVQGQVVYLGKRAISIEYATTEDGSFEMLVPIDSAQTKVRSPLRKISDLKAGDTVSVEYEQTYVIDKDGKRINTGATAQSISLIRAAPIQTMGSDSTLTSTESAPSGTCEGCDNDSLGEGGGS
jgi:hypothetical protein